MLPTPRPRPTAQPRWLRLAIAGALSLWAAGAYSADPAAASRLAAFNACAAEQLGRCGFYALCVERHFPCGPKRYALAFGQKYCEKFAKVYGASHNLAGFVGKTRTTLQQELIGYINEHKGIGSCQQLEDFAFTSHSDAYVRQPFGICGLLDAAALRTIVTTIDQRDLLRPELWRSSLMVAGHCAKSLLWPITHR